MEVKPENAYNVQSAISQLGGMIIVSGYPKYFYDCKDEAFIDLYLKPKVIGEKDKRFIDEQEITPAGMDLSYCIKPLSSPDSKALRIGKGYEFDTQFKVVTRLELFRPEGLALYFHNNSKQMDAFEYSLYQQALRMDKFRKENGKPPADITDEDIENMLHFIIVHMQIKKQEAAA